MSSMKYLLALAVVTTLASTAFAVHCYQCGSVTTTKCGEQFEAEENMKADCSRAAIPLHLLSLMTGRNLNATGCMKQTVVVPLGGGTHILRSCYFGDTTNTDGGCTLGPQNIGSKLGTCDVCTRDLCNSSPYMAPPVAVTIVTIFGLIHMFS